MIKSLKMISNWSESPSYVVKVVNVELKSFPSSISSSCCTIGTPLSS